MEEIEGEFWRIVEAPDQVPACILQATSSFCWVVSQGELAVLRVWKKRRGVAGRRQELTLWVWSTRLAWLPAARAV